jgi:Fe-S cluster assembly protein SufD
MNFPTTRDENWKYTNLSLLSKKPYQFATKLPEQELNSLLENILADKIACSNYIVFINGELVKHQLNTAFIKQKTLKKFNYNVNDFFEKLNAQYHQDQQVDQSQLIISSTPNDLLHLQILYLATQPVWIQPCLEIVLENKAKAAITENFLSHCDAITNSVTRIHVKDNAKLNYVKVQQEHKNAFHIGRTHIDLEENAYAQTVTVSLGSQLARSDIFVNLNQSGATCELQGIYISNNKTHLDHHTEVQHKAPNTTSVECYKGILSDKSRAVFNGKVIVHPQAHKTVAEQANHNLLLSSEAEIDTKPELEIYHDDVKCTHGATIGQLDENALFYLRSRGIEAEPAKKMLIQAFAEPIFNKIQHTELREKLCLTQHLISM